MTDYLPKLATIEQACVWLNERTGKDWSLARLLEYGLMPWVWLEHAPGYPAIFGDRLEGYLAPMVFGGDTNRLAAGGTDALITMTRTGDGALMRINPGIPAPLSELRFKREDIEALAARSGTPEKKAPHGHGVPKEKIIDGFSLDNKNWLDLPAHPNSDGKHYKVIDLKQAAKALKRTKAGVMLLVAQSKLTAFVMARGWKGNAFPIRDKETHWDVGTAENFPDGSEIRILDCRETGESFSVRTFNACQMWALCHSNSYLLAIGHSRRIDADVLAPIDGQDFHLKHPECAPWKDFYFLADEPHLVTWNDLWFDEDEIQAIEHSAASGAPESNEPPPFHPRVGWQKALFDAWPAICKLYGGRQPTATEAIRYLQRNDDSGLIMTKTDGGSLWWIPQRGTAKEVTNKTVANVISQWRNEGALPA